MRIILTLAAALFITLVPSGCYLLQQGTRLVHYQISAKPVHRVINDPETPKQTLEFLQEAAAITRFAVDQLGLQESRNYTSYVETDRNYLIALVNGTRTLSFEQYTWKFPITGEVPYKGFFNPEHARREAQRLEKRGYDTWISAVNAFSTLGYFRDPLYSFMESYSTYRLSDLIIHELTHAAIWVKDQVRFNEELATYIGNRGAELYVKRKYGADSQEYRIIFDLRDDRRTFSRNIRELKQQLEDLYSLPIPDEQKLDEKHRVIRDFQQQFLDSYYDHYRTDRYLGFSELDINNAYISINSIYHSTDDIYRRFHEEASQGDLARMIELLKVLDGTREDPYTYMNSLLN